MRRRYDDLKGLGGAIAELCDPVYGKRTKPLIRRCECGKRIRQIEADMCSK